MTIKPIFPNAEDFEIGHLEVRYIDDGSVFFLKAYKNSSLICFFNKKMEKMGDFSSVNDAIDSYKPIGE